MEFGNFRGFEVSLRDPGIAWVRFNQPERLNGMTHHLKRDLREALLQAQFDDAVRVVVITGSGRAFSAGDDITGRAISFADDARPLVGPIDSGHHNPMATYYGLRMISQPLNKAVRELDKITIAAVNGVVVGGALGLVLACDVRLATRRARLGTAFRNVGLSGDFGTTYLLPRLVGWGRARELFLSGDLLDATTAQELGLVTAVYDDDTFLSDGLAYCARLAQGPTLAFGRMKANLNFGEGHSLTQALAHEALNQRFSALDHDHHDAAVAFANKQEPAFRGR